MTSQAFSLPNLEGRQKHQADEAVCHDLEGDRAEGEQATEGGLSSAGIQATWPRFFCGPHGREAELGASSGVPRRADRPPHASEADQRHSKQREARQTLIRPDVQLGRPRPKLQQMQKSILAGPFGAVRGQLLAAPD